jgi:hypothetical protein
MDKQLIRSIENDYPYPIALEFRRLNTKEYLASDENRLRQILKISETTIHLIALISVVDMLENCTKSVIKVPDFYKKEFPTWFTRTSFGKWISLTRESIRLFQENNIPMFIAELPEYFFEKKSSESKAQKAFNILTSIRNKLAHPEISLTNKIIEEFCIETEKLLETILIELDFLMNYSFLYVDHISVRYPKWQNPSFFHTFSEVIGNSSEFNAYNKILSEIVNTPAIIIVKNREEKQYLNLDPLVIYSNEGENKIPDVFMYIDWDKDKTVKYKPVWNGGSFGLSGTSNEDETACSLLKFFEFFSDQSVYSRYKECVEKLKVGNTL